MTDRPTNVNPATGEVLPDDLPPFSAFLAEIRSGELNSELTAELARLVQAVFETEKAGTLKLTLRVEPGKAPEIVTITEQISVALPKVNRGSLWFVTDGGGLSRRSPNQRDLFQDFENGASE